MTNQRPKYFVVILLLILAFHLFLFLPYTIDDAFIIFKYARNIISGNGYVFNYGDRVNATSSFLWTFLLAPSELFVGGSIIASKLIGIISLACTLFIGINILNLFKNNSTMTNLLFTLILIFNSSIINWSIYGLENAIYSLLIITFLFYFLQETTPLFSKKKHLFFLLLIVLTRPEGFLFIALYFTLLFVYNRYIFKIDFKYILINAIIIFTFVIIFFTLQKLYFGYFLPNTVYAKVELGSTERIINGIKYLFSKINLANLSLIILSVFFAFYLLVNHNIAIKYRFKILAIISVGSVYPIFSILVGGDWMPNNRFITYTLTLNILLITIFYNYYKNNVNPKLKFFGATVLLLYLLFNMYLTFISVNFAKKLDIGTKRACKGVAEYLNEFSNANTKFASSDIGMIGYYYNGKILDWWGLADNFLAHNNQSMGNLNWDYILKQNPDFIYLYSEYPDHIESNTRFISSKSIISNKSFINNYKFFESFYFAQDRYHLIYKRKLYLIDLDEL